MKICIKCHEKKDFTHFPRHSIQRKKGLITYYKGTCKKCCALKQKIRVSSADGKKRQAESKRRWYLKKGIEYHKKWDILNKEKRLSYIKKYESNKKNKPKLYAHWRVNELIRSGRMKKKPCEVCFSEKAHAHHDDYSKPEEVRWLCAHHHKVHHAEIRKKEGA